MTANETAFGSSVAKVHRLRRDAGRNRVGGMNGKVFILRIGDTRSRFGIGSAVAINCAWPVGRPTQLPTAMTDDELMK